jgi:hypothetical protein
MTASSAGLFKAIIAHLLVFGASAAPLVYPVWVGVDAAWLGLVWFALSVLLARRITLKTGYRGPPGSRTSVPAMLAVSCCLTSMAAALVTAGVHWAELKIEDVHLERLGSGVFNLAAIYAIYWGATFCSDAVLALGRRPGADAAGQAVTKGAGAIAGRGRGQLWPRSIDVNARGPAGRWPQVAEAVVLIVCAVAPAVWGILSGFDGSEIVLGMALGGAGIAAIRRYRFGIVDEFAPPGPLPIKSLQHIVIGLSGVLICHWGGVAKENATVGSETLVALVLIAGILAAGLIMQTVRQSTGQLLEALSGQRETNDQ